MDGRVAQGVMRMTPHDPIHPGVSVLYMRVAGFTDAQ